MSESETASEPSAEDNLDCERIAIEAGKIGASPEFARAAVMRKLLDFLVGETIAGRGDQLKGYAVAVDGLGRSADFDSQGDSYPRVQVGRLRRLIDAFYAINPSADGVRLTIPAGRYRVELDRGEALAGPHSPVEVSPEAAAQPRRWRLASAVVALLIVAVVGIGVFAGLRWKAGQVVEAPMLELTPMTAQRVDPLMAEAVRATLLDSLRRTWLIQVRTARRTGPPDDTPVKIAYRLSGDMTGGARPTLFLRLWRTAPDRLIWSARVALPSNPDALAEALAPTMAELLQPYGVLAGQQRVEVGTSYAPGQPCFLQYDRYRQSATQPVQAKLAECLRNTLADQPTNATALAMMSQLGTDGEVMAWADTAVPAQDAFRYARQAVSANPSSSLANHALARAAFLDGGCPLSVRASRRAAGLAPNDPAMLSAVSLYLVSCGDARGEMLARRALRLDPSGPSVRYAPLVYLALDRNDKAALSSVAAQMSPVAAMQPAFHYITRAIAHSAAGDERAAAADWRALKATSPGAARDPAAFLARLHLSPRLREKSIDALRSGGLIG